MRSDRPVLLVSQLVADKSASAAVEAVNCLSTDQPNLVHKSSLASAIALCFSVYCTHCVQFCSVYIAAHNGGKTPATRPQRSCCSWLHHHPLYVYHTQHTRHRLSILWRYHFITHTHTTLLFALLPQLFSPN